jgi:hypothetical protein
LEEEDAGEMDIEVAVWHESILSLDMRIPFVPFLRGRRFDVLS